MYFIKVWRCFFSVISLLVDGSEPKVTVLMLPNFFLRSFFTSAVIIKKDIVHMGVHYSCQNAVKYSQIVMILK